MNALREKEEARVSKESIKQQQNLYTYIYQIEKDVMRTFPKNPSFKGIESNKLSNILLAYAKYNEVIGYAQGMNYIMANAMLLLQPLSA